MAKVILDPRVTGAKISKNIYGHFSEHLGRCIYQGLYVGEDSPIPNVKGMRTDVVQALKKIGVPDKFIEFGYPEEIYPALGMDANGIYKTALEVLK